MAGETTLAGQEQEGAQEDLGRQRSGWWDENSRCKGPEVGAGSCAQSTTEGGLRASRQSRLSLPQCASGPSAASSGRPSRTTQPPAHLHLPPAFFPWQPSCHLTASHLFVSCFSYWIGSAMRVRAWAVAKGSNG